MQFFDKFEMFNEAYESRGLEDMLKNKANSFKRHGINYRILRQVYSRGLEAFDDRKKGNAKAFAMRRVNDFLSKGRTWSIYDTDLADKARENAKKIKTDKKKKKK
jgi:hypothetical protein